MLKNLKLCLLAIIAIFPLNSFANEQGGRAKKEGWSYTVGTGAIYAPSYLGDDDYQLSVVPNIRFAYEDEFFASVQEGVGYNLINNENVRFGPVVKYDFGRKEDKGSPFNIGGSDTDDLLGLGDVDGAFEIGSFIEFKLRPLSAKLEVVKALGGHEGLVANASLNYLGRARVMGKMVVYNLGPNIKIVDSNYNESYFGVSARQSVASGLSQYNSNAGILSYGLGGMAIVPMTKQVSMVVFANYAKLGDEAANSSLVRQRGSDNQGTAGLFLNYSF